MELYFMPLHKEVLNVEKFFYILKYAFSWIFLLPLNIPIYGLEGVGLLSGRRFHKPSQDETILIKLIA
jgi:hypothetical protein